MSPPPTPKFTAPVRRGFKNVLLALREDTLYDLTDKNAPWFRRLTPLEKSDMERALLWMAYYADQQTTAEAIKQTDPIEPELPGMSGGVAPCSTT